MKAAGTWVGRDPDGGITGVTCAGGIVTEVRHDRSAVADGDLPYLVPGLVDLQVNGYAGIDLNSGTVTAEEVVACGEALAAAGVTHYAPTLITAGVDSMVAAARAVADAAGTHADTADAIAFLHVEGPHLSPADGFRGAHPPEHIRPPDREEFDAMHEAAAGLLGMVTMSPHFDGTADYVRHAVGAGVRVALGHTDADAARIWAAVEAGARFSTHLGNGCATRLHRHHNHLWPQLADDRLTAGFIADGFHLPDEALAAMLAAKGERAYLVSDATSLAGEPPGVYATPIGGRVELRADGRLSMAGTEILAGAACPLTRGLATLARLDGGDLRRAVELAVTRPRRVAGLPERVREGQPADLVLFRWAPGDLDLTIETVLANGRVVG